MLALVTVLLNLIFVSAVSALAALNDTLPTGHAHVPYRIATELCTGLFTASRPSRTETVWITHSARY